MTSYISSSFSPYSAAYPIPSSAFSQCRAPPSPQLCASKVWPLTVISRITQEASRRRTTTEGTTTKRTRRAAVDQAQRNGQSKGMLLPSCCECHVNGCEDRRRHQALLVSPGSNRTFQIPSGYKSISFVFFPISTTSNHFSYSFRSRIRFPEGCSAQSEKAGARKGYVGPLFIFFTLTLKFRFILLSNNPSSTVNRKKKKGELVKDG